MSSAAIGLVELEGRAKTSNPLPAAVTGRPSVWWDVGVDVYSDNKDSSSDNRASGGWHQMAARHGGTIDVLEVEDQTGRVVVWLKDADLLLTADSWETGKDHLPAPGGPCWTPLGSPGAATGDCAFARLASRSMRRYTSWARWTSDVPFRIMVRAGCSSKSAR